MESCVWCLVLRSQALSSQLRTSEDDGKKPPIGAHPIDSNKKTGVADMTSKAKNIISAKRSEEREEKRENSCVVEILQNGTADFALSPCQRRLLGASWSFFEFQQALSTQLIRLVKHHNQSSIPPSQIF